MFMLPDDLFLGFVCLIVNIPVFTARIENRVVRIRKQFFCDGSLPVRAI
jgi:hypothetical protein